jgi:hypothetical protein
MQRAKIAAARNPRLPACPILQYPPLTQISRRGESDIRLFYTHLSEVSIFEYGWDVLEPPELIDTHARLDEPEGVGQMLEDFDPGETQGGSFVTSDLQQVKGPPSLSRYSPMIDHDGQVVTGIPKLVDMLRPLFGTSILSAEAMPSFFPVAPADHNLEAAKELFDREALYLADDPGTGKRIAASLAITDLFQQRLVRRVLILCPEWAGRHWVGVLNTWASNLECVFIQGEDELRELGWRSRAHVYLSDFQTFTEDVEKKLLAGRGLIFDVIVLDGINHIRYQTKNISSALKLVSSGRRWALTGSLPHDLQTWLFVFGILTPVRARDAIDLTLPDIEKRFLPFVLRRSKADLVGILPQEKRHEVWLDLDHRQAQKYQEVLTEERDRLSKLGEAVTRTDAMNAIDRLKQVLNFAPDWLDGVKVRALVDLVEDISSSGAKIVVFSQYIEDGLDRLRPALEAYGVLSLNKETLKSERDRVLEAFRQDPQWHVLLMEMGTRTDGEPLTEATYIAHFDHNWNPVVRRRAELRLNPLLGSNTPVNIYEFWVADTIDEEIYSLLAQRGLLPGLLSDDTQPAELEGRITLEECLSEVLDMPPPPEPIPGIEIPIAPQVQPPSDELVEEGILPLRTVDEEEERVITEVQQPSTELVEGDILLLPTEVEEEEAIAAEAQPPLTESAEGEILPIIAEVEEEEAIAAEAPQPSAEPAEGEILPTLVEVDEEEAIAAEAQPPLTETTEGEFLPIIAEIEEEEAIAVEAQPPLTEPEEEKLSALPLETLISGVRMLMQDQGYPDMDTIGEPDEGGGEWIVRRVEDDEIKRAYVRLFRMEKNVDIRKARVVLKALETHSDCQRAYLVTTSGFSSTCKKLAKDSEGKLVLTTGDELSEYLQLSEGHDVDRTYDGSWE